MLAAIMVGLAGCSSSREEPAAIASRGALGAPLAMTDVLTFALQAGLACDGQLVVAGAIAEAESQLVADAVGDNGPTPGCPHGSRDRGIWQINDCYHPEVSDACAFDPACNAQAMAQVSSSGTDWSPWSTYKNGAYLDYMGEAQVAFAGVCNGAGGGTGGGAGGAVNAGPSCAGLGDGLYCGNDRVGGDAATLYRCTGGTLAPAESCPHLCQVNPKGIDDVCAADCGGMKDGLYCGADGVNGDAQTLYRCLGGVMVGWHPCAGGCANQACN